LWAGLNFLWVGLISLWVGLISLWVDPSFSDSSHERVVPPQILASF